ncbi:MAG: P-II family nitrogen regulator [Gallionella sp.]|nr:P-II family nitrogen regulator [Gallionella sp.]MDD4945370.1 P-II family nitrogen regulator [Gallionella sp.]MDD5612439.1 P-II family nitrogen regulator [Gallionella sp.]
MKEIKAIIQPKRLERIRDAFRLLPGFPGMSVSRIQGCSAHSGPESHASLRAELTDFSDKVKLEIVADDDMVEPIVSLIHQHAYSGQTGDGILWVMPVETFHRLCRKPD